MTDIDNDKFLDDERQEDFHDTKEGRMERHKP